MPDDLKPLDLSNLLRDAFLAGAGYETNGIHKIKPEDQGRWIKYDPSDNPSYHRILKAIENR